MLGRRTTLGLAMVGALLACGGGGGGGGSSIAGAQACTDYCAAISATCSGGDTQYVGLDGTCQSYCEHARWPVVADDQDSLSCRNTHVQLAAAATSTADRTMHCGHAGPTGGNVCGSWCENYCTLVLQNCTGASGAGLGFADHASCLAACGALDAGGAVNAPSGDTVQCRLYHAGAAATAPDPHCGHAQLVSSATVGGTTADGPCN